jgi:periplasmic divalent cation tolerance protein
MEPVLLYITTGSREEAISLSRELLSQRLVACTNIMEHVTAMYHWQGEIEHTPEVVVIAKTLLAKVEAVTAKVKALHSYSTPCVLVIPVIGGSPEYINWLTGEVKGSHSAA